MIYQVEQTKCFINVEILFPLQVRLLEEVFGHAICLKGTFKEGCT